MSDGFVDIGVPATAAAPVTAAQIAHGPTIPPQQLVLLYSPAQWEEFIQEWAHYALQSKYRQVQRFGGAGDKGLDIVGFGDAQKLQGVWDTYQCNPKAPKTIFAGRTSTSGFTTIWRSLRPTGK